MKLTKTDIGNLAHEIMDYLIQMQLDEDVSIYFNNQRMRSVRVWNKDFSQYQMQLQIDADLCPLDYFKYVNTKHILSMSFEGVLYDALNYTGYGVQEFLVIFNKHGLYYERGDAWNLSVYPQDDDYDNIEYTDYSSEVKSEPIHIYLHKEDVLPELHNIMLFWYTKSKEVGDVGSCVIGAGFQFNYKGNSYFMSPCSPYQGSISWETPKDDVKLLLEEIGATDIRYEWGVLD